MHEFPDAQTGPDAALLAPLAELRRRLRAAGRPVAVLCLGASGRVNLERSRPERVADLDAAVASLLEALPAQIERCSVLYGGERLVLLEADPQAAALCAELLVEQGREWTPEEGERALWAGVYVGLALDTTERELYLEALIAVAREGAAVARSRGGECVVHTRLYNLVQRRLERELGLAPVAPASQRSSTTTKPVPTTTTSLAAPTPIADQAAAELGRTDAAREELEQRLAARLTETAHLPRAALNALAGADGSPAADPLREAARRLVAEAFDEQRRELECRHREEVELLEQRIRRLLRSLEETESELRRLTQVAGQEPGVPSVYRTIQGLAEGDLQHAVKRELMAQLLEANLELRRRIAGSAA